MSPHLIAIGAKVVVEADEALVSAPAEVALEAGVAAHALVAGHNEGELQGQGEVGGDREGPSGLETGEGGKSGWIRRRSRRRTVKGRSGEDSPPRGRPGPGRDRPSGAG